MIPPIPPSWEPVLSAETEQPYFLQLQQFLDEERRKYRVFPPEEDIFNALKYTPFPDVRVLLLGQDPYHDEGQAHGLAFSVRPGVPAPPSLLNIFKELHNDLGLKIPNHGNLISWAQQGVLLLNAVLTVRAHMANSHRGRGWEQFTDQIIRAVSAREEPVVFLLWGGYAKKKLDLIDTSRNAVIQSAHPSPLSAQRGFFSSKPFSKTNSILQSWGMDPIDWQIADL